MEVSATDERAWPTYYYATLLAQGSAADLIKLAMCEWSTLQTAARHQLPAAVEAAARAAANAAAAAAAGFRPLFAPPCDEQRTAASPLADVAAALALTAAAAAEEVSHVTSIGSHDIKNIYD